MIRRHSPHPGDKTHPHQRPEGLQRTFQGSDVVAVQNGTCMHCKTEITALLVEAGNLRHWVRTATFGPRDVEHQCSREP